MKKRFGILQIIANVLMVLGVVAAALAALGALVSLVFSFIGGQFWSFLNIDANTGFVTGLVSSVVILLVGALYAILLYGYGELINLLLALEENTFNTNELLKKLTKK